MNINKQDMTLDEAISVIKEIDPNYEITSSYKAESTVLNAVRNGEIVPVVHCRDCKWWINGMCYSDNFILRFEEVKPDWFCADGEVATVKNEDSKTSGDVK